MALVVPVASVRAAPATHLHVQIQGTPLAGVAIDVDVTALDGSDAIDTGFVDTVHFDSSDTNATLPNDYTFDGGDNGVHTFSVTFETSGNRSVTVTDEGDTSIDGTDSAPVQPASANHLVVTGFTSPATAGSRTRSPSPPRTPSTTPTPTTPAPSTSRAATAPPYYQATMTSSRPTTAPTR